MSGSYDFADVVAEAQKCADFLQNFTVYPDERKYMIQLQEVSNRERKVIEISMDDVQSHRNDEAFVNNIRNNSARYIRLFEEATDRLMPAPNVVHRTRDVFDVLQDQRIGQLGAANPEGPPLALDMPKGLVRRYEISIVPEAAERPRKIRQVKATDIGHLVTIKGMVTRASDVKPQMTVCTYTCDFCGSEIYQEITGQSFTPLLACPSQRCTDNKTKGRPQSQTRGSRFVKYQEIRLQELPDQVPVGHIPRAITVHCKGEQTRQCGPGDIVTVSGLFLTVRFNGFRAIKAGLQADTYIEAMSIEKHKLGYGDIGQNDESDAAVREIASDPDVYNRLASSIAPEIYGHEDVKKALLLQLIGGVTRQLPDGMKIRGDINICMMGDPGVAKSQLLKYIATVSPRGVYTTGKGSSGVGLTAAVVRDNLTGDMTLEGGALVLADRGICCIDEFDKMDEGDRTAIHEVMEQQTISIAKAGITTTLNARAAVLAAANPLYGRYNRRKSISENVDLPNSLLSRFDLMFLILDKAETETDLALSKHVLHVHKHLRNPDRAFKPIPPADIKRFIAVARALEPTVPQDLSSYIVEAYVNLRAQDGQGPGQRSRSGSNDQAVMTARQLLSILRLSQALARLRLSNVIAHEDVDEAIRLTHASKASLQDDGPIGGAEQQDTMSAIYSIIRDYANSQRGSRRQRVDYSQAEVMVLKKGHTANALRATIQEYINLDIWHLDADGSHIIFDEDFVE